MAKTKNINNQTVPVEPEDIEEPESNGDKQKPKRPTRPVRIPDRSAEDLALRKDLLARLSSLKLDDLKQLSDVPLKIIDPASKGASYYESTLPTIRQQCSDLLDFYIDKCKSDLQRYTELKTKNIQDTAVEEKPKYKKTLLGKVQEAFLPNLEKFNIDDKIDELNVRKIELDNLRKLADEEKDEEVLGYYLRWYYNYLLGRRSLEHLQLDGIVALTDAQILNRGEDGGMDRMRDIFKR